MNIQLQRDPQYAFFCNVVALHVVGLIDRRIPVVLLTRGGGFVDQGWGLARARKLQGLRV